MFLKCNQVFVRCEIQPVSNLFGQDNVVGQLMMAVEEMADDIITDGNDGFRDIFDRAATKEDLYGAGLDTKSS